jgi:flagellar biosynthesis chaperone FliJ
MRAYSFRLLSVQRVRGVELARARHQVAALARALAAARSRELQLAQSCSANSTPLGEATAQQFIAAQEHESRLADALATATEQRRVIEAQLSRARGEAVQAEARAGVLDRLEERRRNEWIAELNQEDAAELDEFATSRATAATTKANRVD